MGSIEPCGGDGRAATVLATSHWQFKAGAYFPGLYTAPIALIVGLTLITPHRPFPKRVAATIERTLQQAGDFGIEHVEYAFLFESPAALLGRDLPLDP